MNKNTYITIAAVVILALAGILLFGRGSEAPQEDIINQNQEQTENTINNNNDNETAQSDTETNQQAQTVVYSNTGFSPDLVVVEPGTTVVFQNQSNQSMWVASNPHPVHTDYSEFDHRRGVSNGESYEFTFTEAGRYDYHNHLSPRDGGSIIVE